MNSAKNFSISASRRKKNFVIKFLVGGVVVLLVLAVLNFFVSPIKNFFYVISSPIEKTFWSAGKSSSFLASFLNGGFLIKENENLKTENQKLLSQIAVLQSIVQANQAQTDVSAAYQNNGFKLLMAGVIGLDANDMLSINKGYADGIAEGMPVVNQQNVLFGKIFKVYRNYSQVMLISNKNNVVNIKVQQIDPTAPEIDGVVKGKGNLAAYLDLIPVDSRINLQDVLLTSAVDSSFPKDLLVGKITKIEKNDQKPFQQAEINLFSNVKSADNLFVITNYKQ